MVNTEDNKAAQHLREVRQWAKAKIDGGQEPPWAWYQYMKLLETIDAILGASAAVTTENSRQSEVQLGAHLRLVDSKYQQDSAQPHQSGLPVHLPM